MIWRRPPTAATIFYLTKTLQFGYCHKFIVYLSTCHADFQPKFSHSLRPTEPQSQTKWKCHKAIKCARLICHLGPSDGWDHKSSAYLPWQETALLGSDRLDPSLSGSLIKFDADPVVETVTVAMRVSWMVSLTSWAMIAMIGWMMNAVTNEAMTQQFWALGWTDDDNH